MYNMWPRCYSFRESIGLILTWAKNKLDDLVFQVYELDRLVHT